MWSRNKEEWAVVGLYAFMIVCVVLLWWKAVHH